ncbi:MAG: NUDIX domain-containing protein, partial [Caulobacterales bacterium]
MKSNTSLRIMLEPVITPFFRTWWRMSRAMTLGVRGVATDDQGRVLLIRHTYKNGWHFPGGGVDSGETTVESVIREMAEEGGIEASTAPVLLGFYSNRASFKNDHVALYRIPAWKACAPLENGEIAERGFFARGDLPRSTTQATRRRLAEIFDGAEISATW